MRIFNPNQAQYKVVFFNAHTPQYAFAEDDCKSLAEAEGLASEFRKNGYKAEAYLFDRVRGWVRCDK